MRRTVFAMLLIVVFGFLSNPLSFGQTGKQEVDRVLVLAMDVSDSVSDGRFDLQIKGYAATFRDETTIRTITGGHRGAVAVTMAQWGGWGEYQQTVRWTLIRNLADGQRFADMIEKSSRVRMKPTSIAWAMLASTKLIDEAPYSAPRSIIDISGDGYDNTWANIDLSAFQELGALPEGVREGINALRKKLMNKAGTSEFSSLAEVRSKVCAAGIEINGLAIEGAEGVDDLTSYYRKHVICRKGSFVIRVENPDSYDEFKDAIMRKIRHELSF